MRPTTRSKLSGDRPISEMPEWGSCGGMQRREWAGRTHPLSSDVRPSLIGAPSGRSPALVALSGSQRGPRGSQQRSAPTVTGPPDPGSREMLSVPSAYVSRSPASVSMVSHAARGTWAVPTRVTPTLTTATDSLGSMVSQTGSSRQGELSVGGTRRARRSTSSAVSSGTKSRGASSTLGWRYRSTTSLARRAALSLVCPLGKSVQLRSNVSPPSNNPGSGLSETLRLRSAVSSLLRITREAYVPKVVRMSAAVHGRAGDGRRAGRVHLAIGRDSRLVPGAASGTGRGGAWIRHPSASPSFPTTTTCPTPGTAEDGRKFF